MVWAFVVWAALDGDMDLRDVVVVVGLVMVFAGLWFVDWRWALVVVGAVLVGLAVFGSVE